MKLIKIIMVLCVFLAFGSQSQLTGQGTDSKQEKNDRKQQKEAKDLAEYNEIRAMTDERQFVFTATQLITNDGSANLDPKINFFYVMDDQAVIQFGFDGVFIGGNGVGGVTSEGVLDKYVVKGDNPKKPVIVELTVRPKAGQGTGVHNLVVKFFGEGYGEVMLSSSGLRMKGQITRPENSIIHEGNKL